MNSNHFLQRDLFFHGKSSKVLLAKEPAGKLMIFVHGFGGDPIKTWELWGDADPAAAICWDRHHFYSYDSLYTQAINSAMKLEEMIGDVTYFDGLRYKLKPNTEKGIPVREQTFSYNRIQLIAHSLGAIICRLALNLSYKKKHEWHKKSELFLFAPAHLGARVEAIGSLAKLMFPFPLKFLPAVGFFKIVTIDDVDISSPLCILHDLIKETEQLQADGKGDFTIAKRVLIAEWERIVRNGDFLRDPVAIQIYQKKHTDICKPTEAYLEPINHLLDVFNV